MATMAVRNIVKRLANGRYSDFIIGYNGGRTISTSRVVRNNVDYMSNLDSNKILTTGLTAEFNADIPSLTKEAMSTVTVPIIADRLEQIIKYNMPGGKRIRATTMLECYKILEKPENITPENWKLVKLLAWCTEMFGTGGMITDDIVDQSTYRRGSLCWYKKPEVGNMAIQDGILMFTSMYMIVLNKFSDKPYYLKLVELFDRMYLNSYTGQCMDDKTVIDGKPDFARFNMDFFRRMVLFKTTEYTLFTPVEIVLLFTGKATEKNIAAIRPVLEEIGAFFQAQNDYQDCYDNATNTGKDGNDISQGKCTWLVIRALELASPADKKTIQECYGVDDADKVQKVKDIYTKLKIPEEFRKYEESSLELIKRHIEKVPKEIPREMFDSIIRKFHKRV